MTDIATLSVEITADAKDLDAVLKRVQRDLGAVGKNAAPVKLTGDARGLVAAFDQGERAAVSFAQARARLFADQGNFAGAERLLQDALRGTTRSTTQTIAVERQLVAIRKQSARAAAEAARAQGQMAGGVGSLTSSMGRLSSVAGGVAGAFGAIGVGLGVQAVAGFATAAGQAALSLERTQATLRAVAGSQERYNEVLGIARANQAVFGGSLEANLGPMQQFLFIANRSGAELAELNTAAQLLSTINPLEGFEGAGVALSEFFAGDITSLAERFNLPRAALRELAAEGVSAQDKLAGLEALLAQQGITADTLAASLTNNSRVYNELGAAGSQAFTDLGSAAAAAAAPLAQFVTGGLQGLSQLLTLSERVAGIGPQIVASAGSYDAYVAQVDAANAALDSSFATALQNVPKLTEAQYAYAQALMASGVAAQDALSRTSEFGANIGAVMTATEPAVAALGTRLAELAAQGGGAEEAAFNLALAFNEGGLTAADLAVQLDAVEASVLANAAAAEDMAVAVDEVSDAVSNQAAMLDTSALAAQAQEQALRDATVAAYEAAVAGGDLEDQARAAAEALFDAGPAGAAMADQLAQSSNGVDQLTAALYRLRAAKDAALGGRTGGLAGLGDTLKGAGEVTASLRALFKKNPGGGGGGGGGGGRGGGRKAGGGGAASAAKREAEAQQREQAALYNRLQTIQERYHDAAVGAETRYQQRLTDIAAEFAAKRADAEQRFANSQFSSRADFYTSLASVDKSQRTAMIQEFEAAQVAAADIAATQGADAGQRYLDEITGIIRERAQRQAAIAKALEDGDKAEAEFLRGVDQIARQNEQRRLEQATQGGDSLAAQEQAAVGEAEAERAAALTEAQQAAQEGLIDAEQRKAEKAAITNEQLQQQLELTRQIAQAGGAPVAATAAAPATTATPTMTAPAAEATGGVAAVVSVPQAEAILSQIASGIEALRRSVKSSPGFTPGAG